MPRYQWYSFVDSGIIFIMLTLAVYHILIYIGRIRNRDERGNLYLSVFNLCLALFVYYNSLWRRRVLFYYPERHTPLVEGLLLIVMLLTSKQYLQTLTGLKGNKIYYGIINSLSLYPLLLMIVPLAGYKNYIYVYRYQLYLSLPAFFCFGIIFILAMMPFVIDIFRKGQSGDYSVPTALAGLSLIILSILAKKILYQLQLARFFHNPVLAVGAVLFVLAQSRRFNREHHQLRTLNRNLEKEVFRQTNEINTAREELQRIYGKRSEMYLKLAHETRTPLTLIRYNLEKLGDGRKLPEELEAVKINIEKLQKDMINYLDAEKLIRGSTLYEHNRILDLFAIIQEKILLYGPLIRDKGLNLETEIADECFIKGDPFAVDRILNTLISNVAGFLKSGSIKIILGKTGNKTVCSINGAGTEEESGRGDDLGLFVARSLITEMDGRLDIAEEESVVTIRMEFPFCLYGKEQLGEEAAIPLRNIFEVSGGAYRNSGISHGRKPQGTEKTGTILIVEDNRELLTVLKSELETDYRIVTAEGGKEALSALDSMDTPDIIISDIMMAGGDGITFFHEAKRYGKIRAVPFVFLSAVTDEKTRLDLFREGAVEFVEKPFSVEELKSRLAALINMERRKKHRLFDDAADLLKGGVKKKEELSERERKEKFEKNCLDRGLTERQKEIALMLSEGLEYKEMAWKLKISRETVKKHVRILYDKINVHNKMEMIRRLFQE